MASKLEQKLNEVLSNFSTDEAVKLSLELHNLEEGGTVLTVKEELLWEKLTQKIALSLN